MMNSLILALMLLAAVISGCKSPGCLLEEKVAFSVSGAISTQLQCKNSDQVHKDITAALSKLALCKKPQQTGAVADFVCPMVSQWAVEQMKGIVIPGSWGCSATIAKDKLSSLITEACRKAPF